MFRVLVDHLISDLVLIMMSIHPKYGVAQIIDSVQKKGLSKRLKIPPHYDILSVIALGRPKEVVVIEGVGPIVSFICRARVFLVVAVKEVKIEQKPYRFRPGCINTH